MTLKDQVAQCRLCPRLVQFRETLPKRASFQDQEYWRKPCPGYGDPHAKLMILGLAPSAHGGNRVGRIFTGDESARFLFACLHEVGIANQSTSESLTDGLELKGCYITAAVKCVPPQNKPLASETKQCKSFLIQEIAELKNLKTILALGQLAFQVALPLIGEVKEEKFAHGLHLSGERLDLFASFHPSPQNTYTGKLTKPMLVGLLHHIQAVVF